MEADSYNELHKERLRRLFHANWLGEAAAGYGICGEEMTAWTAKKAA